MYLLSFQPLAFSTHPTAPQQIRTQVWEMVKWDEIGF